MSKWPGKNVIGLTGNIATGKSVVRKMLEHLGAYSIDADALSHRAIAKGAPGYQRVIDTFGKWILDSNGEIDRNKLGKLVFNDPEALRQLEIIVHPLVEQAVDLMIKRASQRVVVVEAIKITGREPGKGLRCHMGYYRTGITPKSQVDEKAQSKRAGGAPAYPCPTSPRGEKGKGQPDYRKRRLLRGYLETSSRRLEKSFPRRGYQTQS